MRGDSPTRDGGVPQCEYPYGRGILGPRRVRCLLSPQAPSLEAPRPRYERLEQLPRARSTGLGDPRRTWGHHLCGCDRDSLALAFARTLANRRRPADDTAQRSELVADDLAARADARPLHRAYHSRLPVAEREHRENISRLESHGDTATGGSRAKNPYRQDPTVDSICEPFLVSAAGRARNHRRRSRARPHVSLLGDVHLSRVSACTVLPGRCRNGGHSPALADPHPRIRQPTCAG